MPTRFGYDTNSAPCSCRNMDNRRVMKGNTLYLPVQVAGAYLSMGDAHLAQARSDKKVQRAAKMCVAVTCQPGQSCCPALNDSTSAHLPPCPLDHSFQFTQPQSINRVTRSWTVPALPDLVLLRQSSCLIESSLVLTFNSGRLGAGRYRHRDLHQRPLQADAAQKGRAAQDRAGDLF